MPRKILVPLDGSAGSEAALFRVAELARAEGATIRLLHVAPEAEPVVGTDGRVIAYADQEAIRIRHEVWAYLVSAAAALSGLDVELAVRFGEPAEEIVREADCAGVDLIAMATHRRAGLQRYLKGSVAERVERATRVPVLLVTYGERPAADGATAAGMEGAVTGPAVDSPARGHVVRRRFWCAWSQRDVEVEFAWHGLPGLRSTVAVKSCSAFDPPTAIECRRRCVDPAFRRQWEPPLPVYGGRQAVSRRRGAGGHKPGGRPSTEARL